METTTMQTTPQTKKPTRTHVPMNGVDTPTLFATIDAVKAQPELGKFRFRAKNTWLGGTHSRSSMERFDGAGGTHEHAREFALDADHPQVLVGHDQGPTPVEYVLHALATCLTAGIANVAAARGVTLYEVESTVEGDIDVTGVLGVSKEARNGYEAIRVSFRVKGDASEETLRAIVDQSRARSAVFDIITNRVPVTISTNGQ